jgi:LPXTG-site transpeptidase (sortase) family protein
MPNRIVRRIASGLIWLGLALTATGLVMAYPFARDALEAQSAPAALSFVVTLEPTYASPATPVAPTPALEQPLPAAEATVPATETPIPAPVILPDNTTPDAPVATAMPVTPTPVVDDPPDRIVIGAIQLDAPVRVVGWHVEQVSGQATSIWDVPEEHAAGWLKTSAPAGQQGNTVLDGHHNINGEVFRRLVDLKPSDVIELYAGTKVYTYGVTEKHILLDRDQPMDIRIANASLIQPTDDERLTLVTCWPYTSNTHRLIIVARPINPSRKKGIE